MLQDVIQLVGLSSRGLIGALLGYVDHWLIISKKPENGDHAGRVPAFNISRKSHQILIICAVVYFVLTTLPNVSGKLLFMDGANRSIRGIYSQG